MSRLEELIKELCPDGVELYKFDDVCQFIRGITYNKSQEAKTASNTDVAVFRANNITLNSNTLNYDDVKMVVGAVKVKDTQWLRKGDILMCAGSGSKDHIGKVAFIENDMKYTFGGFMGVVRCDDTILPRYMFHILTSGYFSKHLESAINRATINNINGQVMSSFKFPVPPLEVQREIVRILDSFTLLTAELTAELTARKKQYEYYRDELLGRKTVETKEVFLEDIATYSKERIPANEVDEYSYVGVDNLLQEKRGKTISSHVPTDGNLTKYYPGDILIGNIRPYLRKIWFADNIGGTNGDVLVINVTSDKVLPQYLYYNLSSERFFEYDIAKSKGAKMPRGDKDAVMKYNLLLPPIATQKRIVDVLNNFEKICNDISIGLPAEIEARQKQYEFYRDKLLSFKQL